MNHPNFHILLADDDEDDCIFFREALDELSEDVSFSVVSNGLELMNFLEENKEQLPDVLFLDLNMPFKTGAECLLEIKSCKKMSELPIIVYSTSANPEVMDMLYSKGAHYYVRKPGDFSLLKAVIHRAITLSKQNKITRPRKEDFLILP